MAAADSKRLNIAIAILTALYVASQTKLVMIFSGVGAEPALRFQLATDKAVALGILHGWGEAGRAQFMSSFRFDFVHPFVYGALLYCTMKRFWVPAFGLPALLLLPWLAAAGDVVENLLEIKIIRELDAVSSQVVLASGAIAWTKWCLAGLCVALSVAGMLARRRRA